MRVAILGAGAVGLSVAAVLSKVCEVHAVARERHARAIAEGGFRLSGLWGEGTHQFYCSSTLPADTPFDHIIITAKAPDMEVLCAQFADMLRDASVASLQNGVGNEEIIGSFTQRVIGGTIITGFEWRGDAAVEVTVEAGPVRFGRFPEGLDADVTSLVDLFREAGLWVEATAAIRAHLWAKTLYNCALNPIGALMGVPYGALSAAAAWRLIERVVAEVYAVCEAEGVRLPWPDADAYLAHLRGVQLPATAEHHSSMLQDLRRGRRTEIDFINGAVVARGAALGIETPVNRTLTELVHLREELASGPGGGAYSD